MKPSRVIRRPSEKTLAKYRAELALRKSQAALKEQKKTQARKQVEKYQNIFKKEIQEIKQAYKGLPPVQLAKVMRAVKQTLKKYQTLVVPGKTGYALTGIENVDDFIKRLNAVATWDNYSKLLFRSVVSKAERWNVLVSELSAWALPVLNDQIPYSDKLRTDAETIINIFYQMENGVISANTASDNIKGIIGS